MNKIILIGLFCLSGLGAAAQQKSVVVVEKPKPVVLNIPQQKVVSNLNKAGSSLLGGALLFAFGTILKNTSNANSTVGTVIQIGGGASLVYSGICLTKAADAYEKTITTKKKD